MDLVEQSGLVAPASRGWVGWAAVGTSAASLLLFDPVAASLTLLALGSLATLLLGVIALLPPPHGAGQLVWVVLGLTAAASPPAAALASLVRAETTKEANELWALGRLTPPLARACACGLFALAPLALFAPLGYVRSLATLLLSLSALSAAAALVVLPLLHLLLRRPPPPPPAASTDRSTAGASTSLLHSTVPFARGRRAGYGSAGRSSAV